MKTLLFSSILFCIIQTKEERVGYYKYTICNDTLNYTVFSNTEYNVNDTIYLKNK
jgi:hypothetical protein